MQRQFFMASNQDEDQSFEGIHVDLPFLSFQVGRGGWRWNVNINPDDAYERARKRVRARLGFYRHVATYAVVIAAMILIDLVTGGGVGSVTRWVAGIWGAVLLWHAFNVFVFPSVWSRETEERMIEEEMRRHQDET